MNLGGGLVAKLQKSVTHGNLERLDPRSGGQKTPKLRERPQSVPSGGRARQTTTREGKSLTRPLSAPRLLRGDGLLARTHEHPVLQAMEDHSVKHSLRSLRSEISRPHKVNGASLSGDPQPIGFEWLRHSEAVDRRDLLVGGRKPLRIRPRSPVRHRNRQPTTPSRERSQSAAVKRDLAASMRSHSGPEQMRQLALTLGDSTHSRLERLGDGQLCDRIGIQKVVKPIVIEKTAMSEKMAMTLLAEKSLLGELLSLLKAGGGVIKAPEASRNKEFMRTLDTMLPELQLYRMGRIQSGPGVVDVEGVFMEYFRTVGAIIALLAVYAQEVKSDPFGLEAVSAGDRGPKSMDGDRGKAVNMGHKPEEYAEFCSMFAQDMHSERDWWAMLVILAVHDVGKSDVFREQVNSALPPGRQSDDPSTALYNALLEPSLRERLLPSVDALDPRHIEAIIVGWGTGFHLPQLGQGEAPVRSLRDLLSMPQDAILDGSIRMYLYHSIFDIAGSSCSPKMIYPLASVPVYIGFGTALRDLTTRMVNTTFVNERELYFAFLYGNFRISYPHYDESVFANLCKNKQFRLEHGLVVLRLLALTRNTYKNPGAVLLALKLQCSLVRELSGTFPGPSIMMYYGPDMLRMGLGTGALLSDPSGENMEAALVAVAEVYKAARKAFAGVPSERQCIINVQPIVKAIMSAEEEWEGGRKLRELCEGVTVNKNDASCQGIAVLRKGYGSPPRSAKVKHTY